MDLSELQPTISKSKIIDCFGDLREPDCNRIFSLTAQRLMSSLEGRMSNLLEKIRTRDIEQVIFQAHQLKGSFSTMGSTELAFLCHELEHHAQDLSPLALEKAGQEIKALSLRFKVELERILVEFS